MIARLRIKGYERLIGAKRTLQVLIGNYYEEMDLFYRIFVSGVAFRISNDGDEPKYNYGITTAFVEKELSSYMRYRYTLNTLRMVFTSGRGYTRSTRRVQWAPLAPSTLKDRKRKDYEYPTLPRLYRTGKMLNSVIGLTPDYGFYKVIHSRGFKVGATNVVASANEYGTRKIPARPFYYMSTEQFFLVRKIIQLKINTAFRMLRSVMR